MKKFLLIVTLFSVICNGCYELDFDTDFHSGIYEKRYSRIYYTTSDNRPIELDTSLENRVVSNTYSNGQGVLVFEDIVTEIESYTFSDCENLTSLKIPDSVTKIGARAFYCCDGLKKIYIPNSVTTIGYSAFKGCTGELIINSKIVETDYTYSNYPSYYGWLEEAKFTKLTIGDSVTSIGNYAFYYCDSLTSVTIGDSVTTIGDSAFEGCSSLTSVTIGDSVTTIGDSAFSRCSSLTSVHITDLSAWCKIDFSYSSANPLYYAKNLYLNNELVTYLVIPSDITEIKSRAFYNCSSLTSVTIPDSVTTIGEGAFAYCDSLTSVTIGDSVTTIGNYAFYYCDSLTSVTIPDSVTTIGKYAFEGCSSLTSVYCKATTPSTGESYMFNGNASGRKIYVPMESVEAYKSAAFWSKYADAIEGYSF